MSAQHLLGVPIHAVSALRFDGAWHEVVRGTVRVDQETALICFELAGGGFLGVVHLADVKAVLHVGA